MFLCKFSCTVSGPWVLTIGLIIATPVFHCVGVGSMCWFICVQLLCMAPPSGSMWLLEQKGALLVLRFSLHLFLLSLDVVALLCTCFQFTAMFVSCADLGWLQLRIHSFTSTVCSSYWEQDRVQLCGISPRVWYWVHQSWRVNECISNSNSCLSLLLVISCFTSV